MTTTWQTNWNPQKKYPALAGDIKADVVIIGGGLAGITTAYLLAKAGKKVAVLEKKDLSESVTAYTTAFLSCQVDTAFGDLKRMFGPDKARLIWQSGIEAIDMIERIVRDESIDCEFSRCPQYIFAQTENEWQRIQKESAALEDSGFAIVADKGRNLPFPQSGSVMIPNQAKFHALKYADGVRLAAEKYGALFFENTEVKDIEGDKMIKAVSAGGNVSAEWAVIATHNPFNKPLELYGKKGIYLSYVFELSIPANILPEGLYVDVKNPYHYFRVDRGAGRDRMIIGGEDHRKEIPIDHSRNFTALEDYAKIILGRSDYKIITSWYGTILETWDGIPFIGPYSRKNKNQLVATGFSGNGMTHSLTAGLILADTILGKENKYAEVFHPRRGYSLTAAIIKGRDYLAEFLYGALANMFKKKKDKKVVK